MPDELVFGLERELFLGQKIFENESANIFSKFWVCIGRIEDVRQSGKDCYRQFEVDQYSIVVVARADGSISAFHNICRHRGTRLLDNSAGDLSNSCMTCPYHAWTYDLNGNLIGAPNMAEVESFDRKEFGLQRVNCVNWCGFLLVNLGDAGADFEKDFAPLIERLADWELDKRILVKTLGYQVAANWKLLFQNYSECYHCPTVHPNLNRLTPYKSATNDLSEGPILGGPMELSDGVQTVSLDGNAIGTVFSGLSAQQQRSVYYYTVFPNLFVSAHPDYVMVHRIERISNRESHVDCHFFVADKDAEIERASDQWDEVNQQDWRVCELTQKGINSPAYIPGPYSNLESMLVAFDRFYRRCMAQPV